MNFFRKLERRFGHLGIPGLMKYVIACYIIGYVITYAVPDLLSYLTLEPYLIFHYGQVWRLVSWILIPPSTSNLIFALIMLVLYYQLGTTLEQTWGTFRFNCYIFGGMIFTIIGAIILFLVYGFNSPVSIGYYFSTYYINMTIFLAFASCYPDMRVMLYFIIPIKMKWMAYVYVALIAYSFYQGAWPTRIAIIASVLNFLLFFLVTRSIPSVDPRERRRKQEFQRKVNQARPVQGTPIHKCAICGRTEKDNPQLQFRYCSKCTGNFEYCQDHLFTHQHK